MTNYAVPDKSVNRYDHRKPVIMRNYMCSCICITITTVT